MYTVLASSLIKNNTIEIKVIIGDSDEVSTIVFKIETRHQTDHLSIWTSNQNRINSDRFDFNESVQ